MTPKTVTITFQISEVGHRPEVALLETLLVEDDEGRWKVTQPGPDGHTSWVGRHEYQHAAILDYLKARLGIQDTSQEDVRVLHEALSDVLTLFVAAHGWDYSGVDGALAALARNRDHLPIRMVLAEEIERRQALANQPTSDKGDAL